jgi:hypothetical protein
MAEIRPSPHDDLNFDGGWRPNPAANRAFRASPPPPRCNRGIDEKRKGLP